MQKPNNLISPAKSRRALFAISFLMALLLCFAISFAQVKTSTSQNQITGNGMLQVTPAALGVNALTEPASSTSALSSIIDVTGARAITLKFSCTQGNVTVNIQTYAEDGATLSTFGAALSAVPASTLIDLYVSTEQDLQATSGTLGVKFRMPQKAIAFSFTNASATAGTCTARLLMTF